MSLSSPDSIPEFYRSGGDFFCVFAHVHTHTHTLTGEPVGPPPMVHMAPVNLPVRPELCTQQSVARFSSNCSNCLPHRFVIVFNVFMCVGIYGQRNCKTYLITFIFNDKNDSILK